MLCNCMIVCDNNDGRVEVSSDSVKQLDDCPTRFESSDPVGSSA